MAELTVHQALYGYSDGHRLLASSIRIPTDVGRVLRAVSDMTFDGTAGSYLTVIPIASLGAQAFIRTWPAPDAVRPGSVWSHLLFVTFEDLAVRTSVADIVDLFEKPSGHVSGFNDFKSVYGVSITVPAESDRRKPVLPTDRSLAERVIGGFFGSTDSVSVVGDSDQGERILLALFDQQWPELRCRTSFRTRSRSTSSTMPTFDIEVVERSKTHSQQVIGESWASFLADDLVAPDSRLHFLLRMFGPELPDARRDSPGLFEVLKEVREGSSAQSVVGALCRAFPDSNSMKRLKRAVLGPPSEVPAELSVETDDDLARISLLLTSVPKCVDFRDMSVPSRLASAWESHAKELILVVASTPTRRLSQAQRRELAAAIGHVARPQQIVRLIEESEDWGLLVLHEAQAIIPAPNLWETEALLPWLLELILDRPRKQQIDQLVTLVESDAILAAAAICGADPSLWWDAFAAIARTTAASESNFAARGHALGRVLQEIGPGSLGSPGHPLSAEAELMLLAFVAGPEVGVWRHAPTEAWVALVEKKSVKSKESKVTSRIRAIALISAIRNGSRPLRRRAWLATFAPLHQALLEGKVDSEGWSLLEQLIPAEPEWDRCGRLREAAVESVIRDKWPPTDAAKLIQSLPEYQEELEEALRSHDEKRKKNRGWLQTLIDELFQEN